MRFWTAFAEFHFDLGDVRVAGDTVLASAHHFGRGKRSGIEVEMENSQVWALRDGTVVR
jgi:ketosteroid isomerase-like protein